MTAEKQDLEEYTKKQMPLEYEQKLILMGVMKGMQLANVVKPKEPDCDSA